MDQREQLGGTDWAVCVTIVVKDELSRGRGFQLVIIEEYNGIGLHENEGQDMGLVEVGTLSFSSQDLDSNITDFCTAC